MVEVRHIFGDNFKENGSSSGFGSSAEITLSISVGHILFLSHTNPASSHSIDVTLSNHVDELHQLLFKKLWLLIHDNQMALGPQALLLFLPMLDYM